MDDHDESRGPRKPFAGHPKWWWATAALSAIAVVGAVILLTLPL